MIGVSPAFFFSTYSTDFSVDDYCDGLHLLKKLDLGGFQLEIFHESRLQEWIEQSANIQHKADELGLTVTQFVAHFLLEATKTPQALLSDYGFDQMKGVTEMLKSFPACRIITLPIPTFEFNTEEHMTVELYERLWKRLCTKILTFSEIVEQKGYKLALEIVPGSLLGGTEGFLRFIRETGNTSVGFNFDTGHVWSSKEPIVTIPAKLQGRIYGTHLKDNFGNENLPLPPGDGNIPWESLIPSLIASGYSGSFDLEIACDNPSSVPKSYRKGKSYIDQFLQTNERSVL
jgi:sugar phosphate isomerase/epimerase